MKKDLFTQVDLPHVCGEFSDTGSLAQYLTMCGVLNGTVGQEALRGLLSDTLHTRLTHTLQNFKTYIRRHAASKQGKPVFDAGVVYPKVTPEESDAVYQDMSYVYSAIALVVDAYSDHTYSDKAVSQSYQANAISALLKHTHFLDKVDVVRSTTHVTFSRTAVDNHTLASYVARDIGKSPNGWSLDVLSETRKKFHDMIQKIVRESDIFLHKINASESSGKETVLQNKTLSFTLAALKVIDAQFNQCLHNAVSLNLISTHEVSP